MRRALLVLLAMCAFTKVAAAQEPGSQLRVFLLTMGQGDEVYERFGHNAIWIRDESAQTDTAYNWGEFSFEQPHFIQNFLKGKMLYWMGGHPMDAMLYVYQTRQRTMWAQELNLTPAQKVAMQDFIRFNEQEANRFYIYDYYRDNCSTRVRDVLDRILGGSLKRTMEARRTQTTYRSHTRRLMFADIDPPGAGSPHAKTNKLINIGLVTGMDLAMGPNIDEPLTAWTASFVPMELQSFVRSITVKGASGNDEPLVLNERVLVPTRRVPPPDSPPQVLTWYVLAGVVIAGMLALFGSLRAKWSRVLFFTLAGGWTLLIGLLGTIIAGLWAFTDHSVTYGNENLLQANPIALLLFVALIGVALGRAWGRKFALRTSLVMAGLAFVGFVIQVLPGVDQVNGNIIALLLPAHVAIAWVLQKWRESGPLTASR